MQITTNNVFAAFLLASAQVVEAARDQPCVSGECSWSGGDNINSLYSTLSINGSEGLIGDVTLAAGWNIQGCDSNWESGTHSVQMVCSGDSDQTQYCNHLFNGGAVDTIVRLPDNCGKGPFARIISMNESDGVYMMDMDYHLSHISPLRGGVDFSLILGSSLNSNAGASLRKRVSASISSSQIPFSFQKSETFFNQSLSCSVGDTSASLSIDGDGSADMNGTVAFDGSISGSIIPPKIDDFQLTTTVSASGSVAISLEASIEGTVGTGNIPIINIGLPGLDIPGVAEIGPAIEVDGSVDLDIGVQTNAYINVDWNLSNIQLVLPSSAGQSFANASPSSSDPIHLSINPESTSLSVNVTGHIVPKLTFGISVLDDLASAVAFLETDLSATAGVTMEQYSKREHSRSFRKRQNTQACVAVDAGIDISAGVEGSIGPLKDEDNIPILTQSFELFQQCFNIGYASQRRREFEVDRRQDNGLQCPSLSEVASSLESLI